MKKLGPAAAEDLLEIFVRRHETASTIVTTNRPTEDWGQFLGDVPAATAILDRFLAHAEILPMQGKSFRLHQRARRGAHPDAEGTHGQDAPLTASKPPGPAEETDPEAPAQSRRPSRRAR